MKQLKIWQLLLLLPLLALAACDSDDVVTPDPDPEPEVTALMINEFMASNDSYDVDGTGLFPDWVELYNTTTEDINIGGWYMTDSIASDVAEWHQITAGTDETIVPAGGFLLVYFDNYDDGPLYMQDKLGSSGESIGLADLSQNVMVSFTYEQQTTDMSMGLSPDGSTNPMVFLVTPTPLAPNSAASGNLPPVISDVDLDPVSPLPDADVTVLAEIFDDSGIGSVSLYWNVDGGDWTEVVMTAVAKVTGNFTAVIPGQAVDAVVGYYVEATDTDGEMVTEPADAPTSFDTYVPLYQLSFTLYINEFMADNASTYQSPGEYVDPADSFTDWIEIYNPGDTPIDIGGMYISDDLSSNQEYQISTAYPDSTTIPAGGYLVLFADKNEERGVLHVEIKLSSNGEDVGLFSDDGHGHILMVDGYTYIEGVLDVSEGRETDGDDNWTTFTTSTPGATNASGK